MNTIDQSIYNSDFFENQMECSAREATVVVPIILEHFHVTTVLNLGCGVGTSLSEFEKRGVHEVTGLDGGVIDRERLKIPERDFQKCDITQVFLDKTFDSSLCLEVAEHIAANEEDSLIRTFTSSANVVVFSAAIPKQGGVDHKNENWQSYWARKFSAFGFDAYDCIRPTIFKDERIPYYYRQNILVYCKPGSAPDGLKPIDPEDSYVLDRVTCDFFVSRSELAEKNVGPAEYAGRPRGDKMGFKKLRIFFKIAFEEETLEIG